MSGSTNSKFRSTTVIAVVIANMVGTGVFTSLGFQLLEIHSGFALLALWAVGGIAALCGAMTYAELGAALPRRAGGGAGRRPGTGPVRAGQPGRDSLAVPR